MEDLTAEKVIVALGGITMISLLIMLGSLLANKNKPSQNEITTFEECIDKYTLLLSDPPECQTPTGRVFIEE